MKNRQLLSNVLVGALVLAGGCAMFEKYLGGTETAKSESGRESNVRVWLDDSECKWGDVWCEVGSSVGTGPKLKYEIVDADKMGAVSSVIINIFPEEGDGWSSGASHIVLAKDTNNPDAQMKPGTVYPLGSPPDEIRVMDGGGNTVAGVKLESGKKYLMNFVVSAAQSETVGVTFTVR